VKLIWFTLLFSGYVEVTLVNLTETFRVYV